MTLDTRLRYNKLEQRAVLDHGLAVFLLVGGRRHDEKAAIFLKARKRVESFLRQHPRPFIAKIYSSGAIKLWLA